MKEQEIKELKEFRDKMQIQFKKLIDYSKEFVNDYGMMKDSFSESLKIYKENLELLRESKKIFEELPSSEINNLNLKMINQNIHTVMLFLENTKIYLQKMKVQKTMSEIVIESFDGKEKIEKSKFSEIKFKVKK